MERINLKEQAKEALKGNLLTFFLLMITFGIVSYILSFVSWLVMFFYQVGIVFICLQLIRKNQITFNDGFWGFTKDRWLKVITTLLLQSIYTFLWSLLFVIPGIIKSYSYALTPYLIVDNPNLSNNEAISKSKELMDGHKMDLFMLHLSFVLWYVLGIITCGLGFIYVIPYINLSQAAFYSEIIKEGCDKNIENLMDDSTSYNQAQQMNQSYNNVQQVNQVQQINQVNNDVQQNTQNNF